MKFLVLIKILVMGFIKFLRLQGKKLEEISRELGFLKPKE
jgi:hypothetical protein